MSPSPGRFRLGALLACAFAFCQVAPAQLTLSQVQRKDVEPLLPAAVREAAGGTDVRLALYDVERRRFIGELGARGPIAPGELAGIVTAAGLLQEPGPGFTTSTVLERTGPVDEEGVLQGDLILRGGGDPTLGSDRFRAAGTESLSAFDPFVSALREQGVRRVSGNLVAAAGAVPRVDPPVGWQGRFRGTRLYPAISGLTFGDGGPTVTFSTIPYWLFWRTVGDEVSPDLDTLELAGKPQLISEDLEPNLRWYWDEESQQLSVGGVIPRNATVRTRAVLPQPEKFAAQALAEALDRRGIRIDGAVLVRDSVPEAEPVARIPSPTLAEIVAAALSEGEPLYLEVLARLAAEEPARDAVAEWLRQFAGARRIAQRTFVMVDASGLSSVNRLSPRGLLRAWETLAGDRAGREVLAQTLGGVGSPALGDWFAPFDGRVRGWRERTGLGAAVIVEYRTRSGETVWLVAGAEGGDSMEQLRAGAEAALGVLVDVLEGRDEPEVDEEEGELPPDSEEDRKALTAPASDVDRHEQ